MKKDDLLNKYIIDIFTNLYKDGFKYSDIKELFILELLPFFKNREFIINNKLYEILSTDTLGLIKLKSYKEEYNLISNSIKYFKEEGNKEKIISNYLNFNDIRKKIIINYYTIINNQKTINDLKNMSIYDSMKIMLDLIGDGIELLLKYYFYIFFLLEKLDIEYSLEEIEKKDLGEIITKLENNKLLKEFLYKKNYKNEKIKLSHLRNIWAHKKYEINEKNEIIKCVYGKKNPKIIEFNLNDLIRIGKEISALYTSLHLALTFFYFSNNKELINNYKKKEIDSNYRINSKFDELTTGLLSQGFNIIEYYIGEEKSIMTLKDISNGKEIMERAIHSSQFLYNLYLLKKSEYIKINFIPNNIDKIYFSFNVKGNICKKIYEGKEDITYLANNFNFEKFDIFIE